MRVTPLERDGAAVISEVSTDGAVERWAFEGAAGEGVRIAVRSEVVDTVVTLVTPAGEELRRGEGAVDAVLPAAGRYQL